MNRQLKHTEVWEDFASAARYSVTGLARRLGVSTRQLERVSQERFGHRPHRWLHGLRMRRALALLRTRTCTLKECAEVLGYKNAAHFSLDFKKSFGVCPSRYGLAPLLPPLADAMSPFDKECRVLIRDSACPASAT